MDKTDHNKQHRKIQVLPGHDWPQQTKQKNPSQTWTRLTTTINTEKSKAKLDKTDHNKQQKNPSLTHPAHLYTAHLEKSMYASVS